MKNIKFISALIITAILFSYTGCSDDETTNPIVDPPSTIPTIPIKTGYTYEYTNDSLTAVGSDTVSVRTSIITNDVVLPMINIGGQDAYPILSRSVGVNTSQDTLYVRYDSTAGKFYQYGINNFIDSTQPRTWDLIADFSIPRNQSWNIGTVNYTVRIPFPPINVTFSGPLTAKVADSLSFKSTGTPEKDIYAYRIELYADLASGPPFNATAKIYIDYYLGFSQSSIPGNPTGIVRLKLRPFTASGSGITHPVAGFDRKIRSWSTP